MWVLGVAYIAAILSASLTLASTAINGYFASAINADLPSLVAVQSASVVSGALGFLVVCFLVFLLGRGRNAILRLGKRWERWTYILVAILFSGAAIVIAVALGWSYAGISELDDDADKKTLQQLFSIWCGIWAGSCLLQISFYALFLYYIKNAPERRLARTLHEGVSTNMPDQSAASGSESGMEIEEGRLGQGGSEKYLDLEPPPARNFYFQPGHSGSAPAAISIEITYDKAEPDDKISLERGPSNPFSDSRRTSYEINTPRSSSDTSRLSRQSSQHQHQWSWNRGAGAVHSRTNSPESFTRQPTIPEIPSPTYRRNHPAPTSASVSVSASGSGSRSRSRSTSTTTTATTARRPRAASESSTSEEHIHPLFRSDSPTVPPNTTPGTTVTASPIAGQTISMEAVQRIRSAASASASASTPDLRSRSPLSQFTEGEDEDGGGASTPIPGFVLAANRRVSLDKYARR